MFYIILWLQETIFYGSLHKSQIYINNSLQNN